MEIKKDLKIGIGIIIQEGQFKIMFKYRQIL